MASIAYQVLACLLGLEASSGPAQLCLSPALHTRFLYQHSVPFHHKGCFCLPEFTQWCPLHLDAHLSPFQIQPILLSLFPDAASFDHPDFRSTITVNV